MYEENTPPNLRSESAFSGTSRAPDRDFENVGTLKTGPTVLLLRDSRIATAVHYGHSTALLVPAQVIPRHRRTDVLEVVLARFAEPTIEYRLYTQHKPGYKRAYLDLHQLGASRGEKFLIKAVRVYGLEQFAIEFNEARPVWLDNVMLLWESYKIRVGEVDLGLEKPELRTHQGQVVLEFNLGKAGRVKAVKVLEGFILRLEDHSIVQAIQIRGRSVWLVYSRS